MTPGNRTINPGNRGTRVGAAFDYRVAMKSLFMRAQQAARCARERTRRVTSRKRKILANPANSKRVERRPPTITHGLTTRIAARSRM
jgi:hypothetical protein